MRTLLLAIAFLSSLPFAASAERQNVSVINGHSVSITTSPTTVSVWMRITLNEEHFITFPPAPSVTCFVAVEQDGSLRVYATDSNWNGRTLTEGIQFFEDGNQFLHIDVKNNPNKNRSYKKTENIGYDIFSEHCGKLVRYLPTGIVKKFYGAYDAYKQ